MTVTDVRSDSLQKSTRSILWIGAASVLGLAFLIYGFHWGNSATRPSPALNARALIDDDQEGHGPSAPQPGSDEMPVAPELDGGVAWLNTAGPVRLKDIRGKIGILDF